MKRYEAATGSKPNRGHKNIKDEHYEVLSIAPSPATDTIASERVAAYYSEPPPNTGDKNWRL
jgi:hypothetical protein